MSSVAEGVCAGKVAIVTGASRGIGACLAQRLAAEGARVAITARTLDVTDRSPGSLRETVETIERGGGTVLAIQADLSDDAARKHLVRETERQLGPVDILVNNAARGLFKPFESFTLRQLRMLFELNTIAAFELAQLVVPGMRQRKRGWILNISSASAQHPTGPPFEGFEKEGGAILYATTKAALDRFSSGLAAELWGSGIAVNALSPVAAVITPGAHSMPQEVRDYWEAHPEMVEPMEVMVEASLALCCCDPSRLTGRVALSKPLLAELDRPVRTLDGKQPYAAA